MSAADVDDRWVRPAAAPRDGGAGDHGRHSKLARGLGIARALVVRVLRVGAERTAAAGRAAPVAATASGATPFSTQSTSGVSRSNRSSAPAPPPQWPMPGTRNSRLQPRHRLGAAVVCAEPLVVVDGVHRREPRVADAVEEEQLAAAAENVRQVGPASPCRSATCCASSSATRASASTSCSKPGTGRNGRAGVRHQDARDAGAGRDRCRCRRGSADRPGGPSSRAARRSAFSMAATCGAERQPSAFGALARQRRRREAAPARVEDHAVLHAVVGVARVEQALDDRLAIGVGERERGLRLARRRPAARAG